MKTLESSRPELAPVRRRAPLSAQQAYLPPAPQRLRGFGMPAGAGLGRAGNALVTNGHHIPFSQVLPQRCDQSDDASALGGKDSFNKEPNPSRSTSVNSSSPDAETVSRRACRVALIPIAIAAALVASGCGGGGGANATSAAEAQSPSAPAHAGVLYALTPVTGLVGKALLNQGWRVEQGMPPDGEAGALVYVDGSHERASDADVRKLAAARLGALLVDSRQTGPGILMVASPDGSKVQYASRHESGEADLVARDALSQPTPTDAVRFLFAMGRASAENATALLLGPESIHPLYMLPDGKINHELAEVALAPVSDGSIKAAWQQQAQAAKSPGHAKALGVLTYGWQYPKFDFVTPSGQGYQSRAKVSIVSQYEDNSLNTLAVGVLLTTSPGENYTYMFPNPVVGKPDLPAGAYPEIPRRKDESVRPYLTIGPAATQIVMQTGVYDVYSAGFWPNQNSADLDWQVDSYGPMKYVDPDQTESFYSKGFTTAGIVNLGNFLSSLMTPWKFLSGISISGGYVETVMSKQVTNQWKSDTGSISNQANPVTWGRIERISKGNNTYVQSFAGSDKDIPYNAAIAPSQFNGFMLSHGAKYRIGQKRTAAFKADPNLYVGINVMQSIEQDYIKYYRKTTTSCYPRGGCRTTDNYTLSSVTPQWVYLSKIYFLRPGCMSACALTE